MKIDLYVKQYRIVSMIKWELVNSFKVGVLLFLFCNKMSRIINF